MLSPSVTLSPTFTWKEAILPSVMVGDKAGRRTTLCLGNEAPEEAAGAGLAAV